MTSENTLNSNITAQVEALTHQTTIDITNAKNLLELDQIRTHVLGKKGKLTELLKSLGSMPHELRVETGQIVNMAKQQLISQLQTRQELLQNAELNAKLQNEFIDITLPGRFHETAGSLHPISLIRERIEQLFASLGFSVVEGPEIESDFYNFEALNISAHHPARTALDTFYFDNGLLLRTHTSPVQIRVMEATSPPLRIITPGRVYRCDYDQTHTPMFHQLEGLIIDEHCTFADLKGMLQDFLAQLFEQDLKFRFRPSYFPFTEPSAEMDIDCGNGWLEVLGCGMVHPNVLMNCNIDPERFNGFAFGIGLDRLAMLRYKIDDLRKFFENDLRFLKQF